MALYRPSQVDFAGLMFEIPVVSMCFIENFFRGVFGVSIEQLVDWF